jgi:hypothetical protein
MKRQRWLVGLAWFAIAGVSPVHAAELKRFAVDSIDGVIAGPLVIFDRKISSDGGGSLRVEARAPVVVPLFEVTDVQVEEATLIYQARLRSLGLKGGAYLEMWCVFPGKGEFFSRGLPPPVAETMDWRTISTPFFLKAGEKPARVKLNLVITGAGTVWVDDIRLLREPLPADMAAASQWSGAYSWLPGVALGILGAVIGSLAGWLAPKGKARRLVLGVEFVGLAGCVSMMLAGVLALLAGAAPPVWSSAVLSGIIGTAALSASVPVTLAAYRRAEQRRLSAALL